MTPNLLALKLFLDELGVDSNIDTLDDRKRVQKAVYLGQVAGADLGYRFSWYIKGPYSPDLTKDYYSLSRHMGSGELNVQGRSLKTNLKDRLLAVRPILEPPTDVLLSQEDWLELLASLHYLQKVTRYSPDKAAKEIEATKPHLKAYIVQAVRELTQIPPLALS
jgi:uncharacterized protein YwgA